MVRVFDVNTHHAFLNTDIVLSSKLPFVEIIDKLTCIVYSLKASPLRVRLCAGIHRLYCQRFDYEIVVEVEDAIKLGGGRVRNAFVFDNNPWAFVLTKDRMYATNTDTKEEFVEYNLVPDEIQAFNKYRRKTCEYFLLRTKQDYSIYNVRTGVHVIRFVDHIFSNSRLVIFRRDENIIVFNYRSSTTIVEFNEQYSIGEKLFFIKNRRLFKLDLETDTIMPIDQVGSVDKECLLANSYLLRISEDKRYTKKYHLFYLENEIVKTTLCLPHYIESLYKTKTQEFDKLKNNYAQFLSKQKELLNRNQNITICCFGIRINDIQIRTKDEGKILFLFGHIISYPAQSYNIPFVLNGHFGDVVNFDKNISVKECEVANEININHTKPIVKGFVIGKSQSGNLMIIHDKDSLLLYDCLGEKKEPIFNNVFDVSSYNGAYFSSDGKSVVFLKEDKTMGILGFEDMTLAPFEIDGSTVSRLAGFNGYKPEIIVHEMSNRKPVWRDSISLKRIGEEEMSNHIFMSPDGRFSARMQMKTVYYNCLTKQELSFEEYQSLCKVYNWGKESKEEEIKSKTKARTELYEKYGESFLFKHLIEKCERLVKTGQTNLSAEEQSQAKERLNNLYKNRYLTTEPQFTQLFIDVLGYVCYKGTDNDIEKRILIGRSVWFLNYVSFSYDSRFLAFGAKMKEDEWRLSQEGVFVIYDLKEEKIVVRKDSDENLYAIWMTMFSKNGDVAYYDSHANTFISTVSSDFKNTYVAQGKSLLCFSPSGRYIALSDQNYLDYTHHKSEDWGHQPSGNIFIHKVNNLEVCLEHHNDFGEGIDGTTQQTRRIVGSVASAAFSSDEKRLLAVGEDGVVVIRNLHLEDSEIIDEADELKDYTPQEIGNMEEPHIRPYERQNYTDIHVITNDGIVERFFCYWCGPDEKWDEKQGLIMSVDGKELRRCIKINLKTCSIPYGIETIYPNAFTGGLFMPGGCYENELRSIYLPSTIKEIEEDVFMNLEYLKEIIVEYGCLERFQQMLPKYSSIIREEDDLP